MTKKAALYEGQTRCFICDIQIKRGNEPHVRTEERLSKLVSVSQTVEHSKNIISDILSRILNETVMREEALCRVCFGLLNDIDYHLKEAQEKTDDITNKFLDKRSRNKKSNNVSAAAATGTEEMSVNIINKNKAKLLSHVLKPKKKQGKISRDFENPEEELYAVVLETPEDDEVVVSPPQKAKKRKQQQPQEEDQQQQQELRHQDQDIYFARKSSPAKTAKIVKEEKEEESISCTHCKKRFKKKNNLRLHIEKVHPSQAELPPRPAEMPETHKCQLCPREFTNEKSLSAHVSEHKSQRKANLHNTTTNKGQPNKSPGEPKATCPQCKKTFRRHFNMRIHVDRVHNKVKPFPCKFCDKSFATNSDLKQHLTVHGEGKTFKCEECDRVFTNRDSIILHRKQHTNKRTHFCVVCDKGFFKQSCLNRHMRTHTGERPYHCPHCKKGFSQSTTLKTHKTKCAVKIKQEQV